MIEKFEVGKWYRYTGKHSWPYWNPVGKMDYVLDGKPKKCIRAGSEKYSAAFEGDSVNYTWSWREGFELWEEVSLRNKLDFILGE